jgi:hypothetical protein
MVHVPGAADPVLVHNSALWHATALKRDTVRIITGPHRYRTALVIGIDGTDAIAKMDDNLDILIIGLDNCAAFDPAWALLAPPPSPVVITDDEDGDGPRYDPAQFQGQSVRA